MTVLTFDARPTCLGCISSSVPGILLLNGRKTVTVSILSSGKELSFTTTTQKNWSTLFFEICSLLFHQLHDSSGTPIEKPKSFWWKFEKREEQGSTFTIEEKQLSLGHLTVDSNERKFTAFSSLLKQLCGSSCTTVQLTVS